MINHLNGFVGIFWAIRDPARGIVLVTDRTPLARAEPYGDYLTHSMGHYEYWTYLSRFGREGLGYRKLPLIIAIDEYEEWPRGRIVYDASFNHFVIYIDRKLQNPDIVERIAAAFGILPGTYIHAFDSHYRSTKAIRDRGTIGPWWISVPTDQYREAFHLAAAGTPEEAQANLQGVNTAVHRMTNQFLAEALAASGASSQGNNAEAELVGINRWPASSRMTIPDYPADVRQSATAALASDGSL